MERELQRRRGWPGAPLAKRCGSPLWRLRWAAVVCSLAVATCGHKGPLEPPPERALADVAHGVAMCGVAMCERAAT